MKSEAREARPWETIGNWAFPWVPHFIAALRKANLFPIDASQLWVASDYSGAHRGSRFFSIGILVADPDHSGDWETMRRAVRRRFLSDGRRMSFKSLNDLNRRTALVPFLEAANAIRGLLLVFAIDKRIHHFGSFDGFYRGLKERGIILAEWKAASFERMVDVTHAIAVLLSLVVKEGQDVMWISDADDSFATELHRRDCARMSSTFCSLYIKHALGELTIGTTDLDEGDRLEEDLTAIPDLAAGAVGELFNRMYLEFGKIPGIDVPCPQGISKKSDLITSWFFTRNAWQQRIACVAQQVSKGHIQIGTIRGDSIDALETSLIIP